MHTYVIKKGTTNVSIELEIIDDTDGTPETGVVWNTAGIDLQYRRDGAASTAITEATLAALTTAHTDGGFLHIGNGVYRFDLPDAACATGVDKVVIHGTVTGMIVIPVVIQLVAYDPFDAVRMGMTALPSSGTLAVNPTLAAVTHTGAVIPTVTTLTNLPAITSNWLTAAGINAGALDGKGDWNIGKTGYSLTATTGLGNQTANITGNLSGSVGSVTGAVGSVTGAVGSVAGNVDGNVTGSVGSVTGAVGSLVGHTVQTGDSFARIGAAGAGLTDLGGMSTAMKAEVLVEVLKSLTTQLTESYAANGTAPTLTQGIMAIHQMLMEFAISGTSLTVKKLDSSTTAFVVTLDDATNPTSNTR